MNTPDHEEPKPVETTQATETPASSLTDTHRMHARVGAFTSISDLVNDKFGNRRRVHRRFRRKGWSDARYWS